MYWKVAAFSYYANCKECHQNFLIPKLFYCLDHSEKELKEFGENIKFYKCCKKDEKRFSLVPKVSGCVSKMH